MQKGFRQKGLMSFFWIGTSENYVLGTALSVHRLAAQSNRNASN